MDKPLPKLLTIRKTKRVHIPTRYIFLDTETRKESLSGRMLKHVLRLGHAIYWQRETGGKPEVIEHYDFTNSFDLWNWVGGKIHARETVYLFSHNVTFDFLVLDGFRLLPCIDFTLQSLYYKFTTAVLRFANKDRRLVVADTMNYFPVSLDKLASSIGKRKGKVDFDNVTDEVLMKYCRQDTEIIFEAVRFLVRVVSEKSLGSFKPTAPAMASSIFRHTYMKHEIVTSHTPEHVAFEREAYTGGYVNVHSLVQAGRPELVKVDVNSMYPSVMLDSLYPTRMIEWLTTPPMWLFEQFLRVSLVIARVQLHAKDPIYPMRTTGGIVYPIGDFTATLTTPMLRHALERGEIEGVEMMSAYDKAPIFHDYIKHMTGQRGEASDAHNLAMQLFYKTMSNSLYGKFGQQMMETKKVGEAEPNDFAIFDASDPVSGEFWRELHAGGSVIFIYEKGEGRYTSYAIAAHVTDYARLKLFQLMESAGRENVFYADTDSLIVNAEGYARLSAQVHPTALGMLKVEDRGRVFVGLSKKDYILGGSRKLKGFSPDGIWSDGNVFKTFNQTRFYGAARRNLAEGVFWHEVNKRYAPFLRNVQLNDVGRVEALRLPEDGWKIGSSVPTLARVRELAKHMLTSGEKKLITPYLSL